MRLSSKILKNVENVNSFETDTTWYVSQEGAVGENKILYFQLIDKNKNGLRYIPSETATVKVRFSNLEEELVIVKNASIAFGADRSIWRVDLMQEDLVSGGNVAFEIDDNGIKTKWFVVGALTVEKINSGAC